MSDQPKASQRYSALPTQYSVYDLASSVGYIGCEVEVDKIGVIWTSAALSSLITTSPQEYEGAATAPGGAAGPLCLSFRVWWHERRKLGSADARVVRLAGNVLRAVFCDVSRAENDG
jgi:hypothetical protein